MAWEPRVGLRRMAEWPTGGETRVLSAQDLLSAPDEEAPDWLLPEVLPARGLSVISSKSEFENRAFALRTALAVARGGRFMGRETKQGSVLCWIGRASLSRIKQLAVSMALTPADPIEFIVSPMPSDVDRAILDFTRYILRLNPSLVVVDALPNVANHALPLTTLAEEKRLHLLIVDSVATDMAAKLLLRWFTSTQAGDVSLAITTDIS